MNPNFSYGVMIKKGLKSFILIGLPFLVSAFVGHFPAVANLTIGGALTMLENYATEYFKS